MSICPTPSALLRHLDTEILYFRLSCCEICNGRAETMNALIRLTDIMAVVCAAAISILFLTFSRGLRLGDLISSWLSAVRTSTSCQLIIQGDFPR